MTTEEQYIEVYNEIGNSHFCHGDDNQLREWGNSEDRIREIKVEAIKRELKFFQDGIRAYRLLNKLCGGINAV